jgi:hypothetical protein
MMALLRIILFLTTDIYEKVKIGGLNVFERENRHDPDLCQM